MDFVREDSGFHAGIAVHNLSSLLQVRREDAHAGEIAFAGHGAHDGESAAGAQFEVPPPCSQMILSMPVSLLRAVERSRTIVYGLAVCNSSRICSSVIMPSLHAAARVVRVLRIPSDASVRPT